ncbi:sensor histidine kinase [Romboutsia weinsteinii]|uniref:histidine kinase n=1 Tax=Romboutsia weinsteinii TaxID=2020949 RepID=A0A371J267_9FIRM|nr:sensor histidine kinase [Romboutsia weinsteinii]RDY26773.1 sensor histidine kinase [Romboutsia weinsteinii]
MRFLDFLKDKIGLLVFNFIFLFFTVLVVLLSPIGESLIGSVIYIIVINLVLISLFLVISYFRKSKLLSALKEDINTNSFREITFLKPNNEESIYIDIIKQYEKKCEQILNKNADRYEENQAIMNMWVHDIKMPISIIKLIIEQNEVPSFENTLDDIDNEVMRIENAVERVLYLSRLENFHRDFLVQSVNLEKIIREVIRKYSKYFISNKITLNLQALDYTVLSDKKWLLFIFDQLIGNALKYTNKNDSISIFGTINNGFIEIHIKDSGCGIKKEDLNRVFEKGFTGSNGRNNAKSTGLGLFLVKELCDKLEHKIKVNSIYGEFSEFIIYFNNSL